MVLVNRAYTIFVVLTSLLNTWHSAIIYEDKLTRTGTWARAGWTMVGWCSAAAAGESSVYAAASGWCAHASAAPGKKAGPSSSEKEGEQKKDKNKETLYYMRESIYNKNKAFYVFYHILYRFMDSSIILHARKYITKLRHFLYSIIFWIGLCYPLYFYTGSKTSLRHFQ